MVKLSSAFYRKISKIGLKKRWEKEHAKVRINKEWSEEKIGIHAYLCGDGYIKISKDKLGYAHHIIRVYPDDKWLAEFIVKLFKKEFNIKPSIRTYDHYFKLDITNKPACLELLSIGKYNTRDWEIPKDLPKEFLAEWIKCFFDCESNVDIKGRRIALKSVNFNGLLCIQDKLNLFEIKSKVYGPYQPKNQEHSKYGILVITGTNIEAYQRLINFHHPAKKKKLKKLLYAHFV